MKNLHRLALIAVVLAMTAGPAAARKKSRTHPKPSNGKKVDSAEIEAATRLQVFLDRANFSPGALNGRYSEFTTKALTLYRQSRGERASPSPPKSETAPDVTDLDLAYRAVLSRQSFSVGGSLGEGGSLLISGLKNSSGP